MLQLSPNPKGIRYLLEHEIERLEETYGPMPDPRHTCITCGGNQTFRWRAPGDPTNFIDYACNCMEQCALYIYLLHCGIDKAYQQLAWQDVEAEPGAVEEVQLYVDEAPHFVRSGLGLILYGEQGTGKTLLSTLLLKHVLSLGIEGYFVPFPLMIDLFTEGWRDNEKASWFRRRVENSQLLVLDDVGKEHMQKTMVKTSDGDVLRSFSTSVTGRVFDAVIRHRVAAAKPTILTTNFDLDKLQESYGSNVFSLLSERSMHYRFTGANFRTTRQPERFRQEVRNKLTRPIVLA